MSCSPAIKKIVSPKPLRHSYTNSSGLLKEPPLLPDNLSAFVRSRASSPCILIFFAMAVNIFSMPSSSALLLFSLAFGLTNARPWQGATKTAVYQADEWSPRPTNVPVNPRELFKRKHLGVEVCGWLGGNSASPVACGSGSSCVHDTVHGYIGCCATSGPCSAGVYTSCVDESSSNWGEDSGLVNDGIFTWWVTFRLAREYL